MSANRVCSVLIVSAPDGTNSAMEVHSFADVERWAQACHQIVDPARLRDFHWCVQETTLREAAA